MAAEVAAGRLAEALQKINAAGAEEAGAEEAGAVGAEEAVAVGAEEAVAVGAEEAGAVGAEEAVAVAEVQKILAAAAKAEAVKAAINAIQPDLSDENGRIKAGLKVVCTALFFYVKESHDISRIFELHAGTYFKTAFPSENIQRCIINKLKDLKVLENGHWKPSLVLNLIPFLKNSEQGLEDAMRCLLLDTESIEEYQECLKGVAGELEKEILEEVPGTEGKLVISSIDAAKKISEQFGDAFSILVSSLRLGPFYELGLSWAHAPKGRGEQLTAFMEADFGGAKDIKYRLVDGTDPLARAAAFQAYLPLNGAFPFALRLGLQKISSNKNDFKWDKVYGDTYLLLERPNDPSNISRLKKSLSDIKESDSKHPCIILLAEIALALSSDSEGASAQESGYYSLLADIKLRQSVKSLSQEKQDLATLNLLLHDSIFKFKNQDLALNIIKLYAANRELAKAIGDKYISLGISDHAQLVTSIQYLINNLESDGSFLPTVITLKEIFPSFADAITAEIANQVVSGEFCEIVYPCLATRLESENYSCQELVTLESSHSEFAAAIIAELAKKVLIGGGPAGVGVGAAPGLIDLRANILNLSKNLEIRVFKLFQGRFGKAFRRLKECDKDFADAVVQDVARKVVAGEDINYAAIAETISSFADHFKLVEEMDKGTSVFYKRAILNSIEGEQIDNSILAKFRSINSSINGPDIKHIRNNRIRALSPKVHIKMTETETETEAAQMIQKRARVMLAKTEASKRRAAGQVVSAFLQEGSDGWRDDRIAAAEKVYAGGS